VSGLNERDVIIGGDGAKLREGSGVPQLADGVTVLNDGATDSLTGSGGRDWFFAQLAEVLDKAADEDVD